MSTERASIFEDEELDLTGFEPRTMPPRPALARDAIRNVAEQRGFVSREPSRPPQANPDPTPVSRRRYTTGRNRQLNMKVTDEALRRFYALADTHGWVLGEAFEHALSALERESASGRAPAPERTSQIGEGRVGRER